MEPASTTVSLGLRERCSQFSGMWEQHTLLRSNGSTHCCCLIVDHGSGSILGSGPRERAFEMFTVTGTRNHDERLAVPCGSYREAVHASHRAEVQGWQGVRIDNDDTDGAWLADVRAAVREVFPCGVAEKIERTDAFGALVYRVRECAELYDRAPRDVLRRLEDRDLWFASEAEEPATFLAAKVRDLRWTPDASHREGVMSTGTPAPPPCPGRRINTQVARVTDPNA